MLTRRKFLGQSAKILASALLIGPVGMATGCGSGSSSDSAGTSPVSVESRPNILLLMMDQLHIPPEGYAPGEGVLTGIREILGFQELSPDNPYQKFFTGFLRLRKNAVVMNTHYTASAACTPSRACIMTGQYNTGVDQTTGMFRTTDDVIWLDPAGIPTIGDWFRAAGYSTHYFGKWHVSDPQPPDYLEPWGFADWESSYPEPHGGDSYNLGVYRDVGFANDLVDFFAQKGETSSSAPWLAVGSLVDPHDCSSWPVNWQLPQDQGVVPWTQYPPPPSIPSIGQNSLPDPDMNGFAVSLNPDGFPQDNFSLPPTFGENLAGKPGCQYDYSLKYGLAIKSKSEVLLPYPFQLQGNDSTAWFIAYDQFYTYCTYLVDLQLRRILQALDANNLTDNTIVVFLSDHGEMTGAHGGMIQKWHNAYEEIIRVPMVISSPLVNTDAQKMRRFTQPTSSIDVAPTLLGLAGFSASEVNGLKQSMSGQTPEKTFAGADLSTYIRGLNKKIPGPDGNPRPGVLFITNDMITELGSNPDTTQQKQYSTFLANVDVARQQGYSLEKGPVRQPNNIRALCTGDWKIVRYVDPNGVEADEWELYYLVTDPCEASNIVNFSTGEVRDDVMVQGWTTAELRLKNQQLKSDLAAQETLLLKQP